MIMVLVTVPVDKAQSLAKTILAARVCACVNIIRNIDSFFWWKGKIDQAAESLLLIKTKKSLFKKLESAVKDNHPYDVPEIISFTIDDSSKEYYDWLNKEVNAA